MSRRMRLDVAIVGGGVVGAACALALADAGLSVALVEGREPAPWQAAQPDLRVFAFAADNVQLLNRLGHRRTGQANVMRRQGKAAPLHHPHKGPHRVEPVHTAPIVR